MQLRHEVKHEIANTDLLLLRQRLRAVMQYDSHAENGIYTIRSLYFDNVDDKALRDKTDGVRIREKYRLRLYNFDRNFIKLERKFKTGSLGYKQSVSVTAQQAQAIADGDIEWMKKQEDELFRQFYFGLRQDGLQAKVIVDYDREPFVFPAGNVRVTLDYNIRTGMKCTDFLNPDCLTVPLANDPAILEVKWDQFLPDVVRNAVQLDSRRNGAFSKYAACRMYD